MSSVITYQFRIKDSASCKYLKHMAGGVNLVWNYCNETAVKAVKYNSKWLSAYDLNNLTSGCGSQLNIHSQTVQRVCEEYIVRRKQFKKLRLNWRSKKRSLGWIPFKSVAIKIKDNSFTYCKRKFKFWKSREIKGKIKQGSFTEDSRGRWYINLQCEVEDNLQHGNLNIGVDLGLKTQATLSDGRKFERENITKKYKDCLAMAQRAGKKRLVKQIYAKIANVRKDWNHKTANAILKDAALVIVGDVNSSKLVKTKMAKSVLDAGWYQLKSFLKYKAIRLGTIVKEVNESWTSRTCNVCRAIGEHKGLSGLSVRYWTCDKCGASHDRDVNAAINILNIGLGHQTPIKGIPQL